MSKPVPIGTSGTCEERVQFDQTLTSHHHELPPVLSTPEMIRLMETAGFHAMKPFCDPGEISVGTAINIVHRAPAGLNAFVKAEAILESVDGRFYNFKVKAVADGREIGSGTVQRAFIVTDEFLKKNEIPRP